MADATDAQMLGIYRQWTGHPLKGRGTKPQRGEARGGVVTKIVSGEDLILLDAEFAKRSLSGHGRTAFVRRQLGGRETIRTRQDFARVYSGLSAMNRRDRLSAETRERGEKQKGDESDGRRGERGVVGSSDRVAVLGGGGVVVSGHGGGDGESAALPGAGAAGFAGGLPGADAGDASDAGGAR
jgi:hypothetical protein